VAVFKCWSLGVNRREILFGAIGAGVGFGLREVSGARNTPLPGAIAGEGWVIEYDLTFGFRRAEATVGERSTLCEKVYFFDQFGQKNNGGGNYLADNMAPPECKDPGPTDIYDADYPFHEVGPDTLKCFVKPKDRSATRIEPAQFGVPQPVGASGFRLKTPTLSEGLGSRFGRDVCWETRCRLSSPLPYYWWGLWISGERWDQGAELDVPESFGFDNGLGLLNYDGRSFHVNSVGGRDEISSRNWSPYLPSKFRSLLDWHTFTTVYTRDDTWQTFVDGELSNRGSLKWNYRGNVGDQPLSKAFFLIDNSWGHQKVASVRPSSVSAGIFRHFYYEYDFTRIWIRS
jgi:hypothetical protein